MESAGRDRVEEEEEVWNEVTFLVSVVPQRPEAGSRAGRARHTMIQLDCTCPSLLLLLKSSSYLAYNRRED